MRLLILALLWLLWCCLHSLLITPLATSLLQRICGSLWRYFRVAYNLWALLSLLPLLYLTYLWRGTVIFAWQGNWQIVRFVLLAAALLLFRAGARRYDLKVFLGISQLRSASTHTLLSADRGFIQDGIFAITRHPWYLGSLGLLWSALPVYHDSVCLAVTILSLYLVLGTLLEERKIVLEIGDPYRIYQQEVSMLLPWKWLMKGLSRWKR